MGQGRSTKRLAITAHSQTTPSLSALGDEKAKTRGQILQEQILFIFLRVYLLQGPEKPSGGFDTTSVCQRQILVSCFCEPLNHGHI